MKVNYYEAILNASSESMVLLGLKNEVLALNTSFKVISTKYFGKEIKVGDEFHPKYIHEGLIEFYEHCFESAIKGNVTSERKVFVIDSKQDCLECQITPVYLDTQLIGLLLSVKNASKEIQENVALRNYSKTLKSIIDNTEIAMTLLDANHKIVALNRVSEAMIAHNSTLENFIGRDFRDYIPDSNNLFYEFFPKALKGESSNAEIPYENEKSEVIWYQTRFNPVYDANTNEIIGVSIFANDITQKKTLELILKENEAKFNGIVEKNQVGLFMIQKGRFIYVNKGMEFILGYKKQDLLNFDSYLTICDANQKGYLKEIETKLKTKQIDKDQFVFSVISAQNKTIQTEIVITPTEFNNEFAIVGTLIDITDRIDEERRINAAVLNAQEKERLQIGMELHDNVKQILAGTSLFLELALEQIHNEAFVTKVLKNLKESNNEAIIELRRLSHQLAPLIEGSADLSEKIDWLIDSLNLKDTIDINLEIEKLRNKLSNDLQLAIYRILQEQLTNVLKYSHATKLKISIKRKNNRLIMNVKDNGVGFDTNKKREGIGFENIRRRTLMLNGKTDIASTPGNGCELNVSIPMKN